MDESLQSFSPTYNQLGSSRTIISKPPGSTSSGLKLVLPSLRTLKATNGANNSKPHVGSHPLSTTQDVDIQEKKIPRPLKLKPLKEVLTKLIAQIKKKDDYAFFLTPVDTTQVPGYTDVITRPMDLGTMTNKVNRGKYRSLEDFASDLRLVTTNAKIFNPPGSLYYTEADRIEAWGLDHIAKAAPTVIQYETDWNIDIEKDEEDPAVDVDVDDQDMETPMEVDPTSGKARSASVVSQVQPTSSKRGPRGPYKKSTTAGAATFSESLDADGGLPGSKDGLGAFSPGSDWAKTMLALKLKGKRYRTKKERLRFEKEGPPYLPDGSLDYTEMEDPFTILSSFAPDQPTRPYLTPLYPPLSLPAQQPQWLLQSQPQSDQSTPQPQQPPHPTPFPTAVTVPLNRPLPELPPITSPSAKRRHWTVLRNVATRYKGKEKEDDIEALEAPPWQVPREAHATDFGSFALLAGELAEEMKRQGMAGGSVKEEEEQEAAMDAIRGSLNCEAAAAAQVKTGVGVGAATQNGMEVYGSGYWNTQRAAEAEEYIRDVVYGGVDGLAYVRSLAEFVTLNEEQELMFSPSEPGALGMPLAQWVQQNVVDTLTEGRHSILRETAIQLARQSRHPLNSTPSFLKQEDGFNQGEIANQIAASLRVYPGAVIALSALLQIRIHKIDMGALIKAPDELFVSEEVWAGKGLKDKRKLRVRVEEKSDAMEVEEPERTWMEVNAIANSSSQTNSDLELEGPEELNEVLEYVAGLISDLDRRIRTDGSAAFTRTNGQTKQDAQQTELAEDGSDAKGGDSLAPPSDEDLLVRNLRLNLLALAKRAPLDTIARLPKDLVPEHIRQYVPTLGTLILVHRALSSLKDEVLDAYQLL